MSWPRWRQLAVVLLTCTLLAPLLKAEEAFVIHLSDDSSDEVVEELAAFEPDGDALLYEPVAYGSWLDDAPGMLGDGFFGRSGPVHRDLVESPAEVTGSRRVGDSFSSHGVEESFIGASEFQVIQTGSAGEQVECDVQHVIGFVIGEVQLEQRDGLIDVLA